MTAIVKRTKVKSLHIVRMRSELYELPAHAVTRSVGRTRDATDFCGTVPRNVGRLEVYKPVQNISACAFSAAIKMADYAQWWKRSSFATERFQRKYSELHCPLSRSYRL